MILSYHAVDKTTKFITIMIGRNIHHPKYADLGEDNKQRNAVRQSFKSHDLVLGTLVTLQSEMLGEVYRSTGRCFKRR